MYKEGILVAVYEGGEYFGWDPKGKSNILSDKLYKKKLTFSVKVNDYLNLRPAAKDKSKSLAQLKNDTKLIPTGNVKDGWAEVTTEDGKKGWVSGEYITPNY